MCGWSGRDNDASLLSLRRLSQHRSSHGKQWQTFVFMKQAFLSSLWLVENFEFKLEVNVGGSGNLNSKSIAGFTLKKLRID